MGANDLINAGIVGACARGGSFKSACDALESLNILAVCDVNEEGLEAARERLGAAEKYTDDAAMLEQSGVDAVILGTPMQFHVPQAIERVDDAGGWRAGVVEPDPGEPGIGPTWTARRTNTQQKEWERC